MRLALVQAGIAVALLATVERARAEGAPAGDALTRVQNAHVLRWGADVQGGEPFVYQDPSAPDRAIGFEVELAASLACELGVRAEMVQNDWSTLVPSLERGSFDVVMNGLEVTRARAATVLFTRPYYVFAERLMARRGDARFTTELASLRSARVGTLASSYAFELLRDTSTPVTYEGVQEPYVDLARGRVDAVLLDDIIAARYGEPNAELAVVGDVTEGYYAIAVRRTEPDLRGAIDRALGRVIASGELTAILRRAGIDGPREARLAAWSEGDQARMLGAPSPGAEAGAPAFTLAHAWLFVKAAGATLAVSTLAMAIAVVLGMALALLRLHGPRPLARAAGAYVEIYRGTPVLLQLYVLYFGLAQVVRIDAFTAAVVGLGMNYAAYEAEVYRAGIQAVPAGQTEAALSLGMTMPLALRRVILPQALRIALPAMTNDFIALLKDSALVSVITVVELTKQMAITSIDLRGWLVPGAVTAALYMAMSYPLSLAARYMERRLARA